MSPSMPRPSGSATLSLLCLLSLTACATGGGADPELVPDEPVRVAPAAGAVRYGDCREALRRAAEKPDLDVDRLPMPKAMVPPPIVGKSMPASVRSAKYSEIRVAVLVDTLGRADMRTFTVLKSTNAWLSSSVKSAVPKWTFEPAELAGCKVPRIWKWGATAGKPPKGSKA
jgi:hypothetical protein